ncbi:MAG: hypothetical protein EA425_04465 [Puniceicoccaceae bacterium]|nr:MAG: hypothetical protein EA425_04465 [Puniceicoccaceae bacterium]
MKTALPIILVVEDLLSEGLLRRMLSEYPLWYDIHAVLGHEGYGFIKKRLPAFNRAARRIGFVVMTDLDQNPCPALLLRQWLPEALHPNLLFRVAVREAESWLLAHRKGLGRFLGIKPEVIPSDPDAEPDAKAALLALTRQSPHAELRRALLPAAGRRAAVGPDYNGALLRFVYKVWKPTVAARHSESLRRALHRLECYHPEAIVEAEPQT